MTYKEKVGCIKAYVGKTSEHNLIVRFKDGVGIIMEELYIGYDGKRAIENLFTKLDIYTEEWLWLFISNLEKITADVYKTGEDLFMRIGQTRFFKHSQG